jgi:very-short-patch-repair endonuclease
VRVRRPRRHAGSDHVRAFERDRLRDADVQATGYRVMRVTWRQLVDKPEALVARIAQAIARPPMNR